MKLHVFNPEHDIALAANLCQFTAPHAGRQLRSDLGHIPALWASDGDMVLVDDVAAALTAVRHLRSNAADVCFVSPDDLRAMHLHGAPSPFDEISVWGWDRSIVRQLRSVGVTAMLPDDSRLARIRQMSSRQWAAGHILGKLASADESFVGAAWYVTSKDELQSKAHSFQRVLKAPWSSSGRGVRYELTAEHRQRNEAWARNVIRQQGGIMVEPYYNKVVDFGMEFEAAADGQVRYSGLSVFKTTNGAYVGSVIASEKAKREMLGRYLPEGLLEKACEMICEHTAELFRDAYEGPFGVDMMVVSDDGVLKLHPCVELNLRRTMGHVALALPADDTMPQRLMRISYTDKYRLHIIHTNENVINTSLVR